MYESMSSLADKAEYEGGYGEFLLYYGLDIDELPSDAPEGLAEKLTNFKKAWDELQPMLPQ